MSFSHWFQQAFQRNHPGFQPLQWSQAYKFMTTSEVATSLEPNWKKIRWVNVDSPIKIVVFHIAMCFKPQGMYIYIYDVYIYIYMYVYV